jgi:DNA-binding NarL/FixJ family response regulator
MNPARIRIAIVDDDPLVRSAFRVLLGREPDFEIVGEAADGAQAVQLCDRLTIDVMIMDVRMPVMDGIQATAQITGSPRDDKPRVLVATTFENDAYVFRALGAGASGFILKRAGAADLISAVRVIARGESMVFPAQTRKLIEHFAEPLRAHPLAATLDMLTPREREILSALAAGETNAEIAERFVLSLNTVKTHVAAVLGKLGARDRAQAVVIAYETGFVRRTGMSS